MPVVRDKILKNIKETLPKKSAATTLERICVAIGVTAGVGGLLARRTVTPAS